MCWPPIPLMSMLTVRPSVRPSVSCGQPTCVRTRRFMCERTCVCLCVCVCLCACVCVSFTPIHVMHTHSLPPISICHRLLIDCLIDGLTRPQTGAGGKQGGREGGGDDTTRLTPAWLSHSLGRGPSIHPSIPFIREYVCKQEQVR